MSSHITAAWRASYGIMVDLALGLHTKQLIEVSISVAYRYRKSISIIELFVSIYIDIYRVLGNYFLAIFIEIYRVGDNTRTVKTSTSPQISE